jgi:hypothetical protein
MSFCSGLLEGAAMYLFTGERYGDVALNITTVAEARAPSPLAKTNKVNVVPAAL